MKALRAIAASSTLLLAALLAHILAGGSTLTAHSGLLLIGALTVIAFFIGDTSENPVRVVIAIFIAQNAAHFITGGSVANDNQMAISHIAAGFLSYHLLRHFDQSLPSLADVFLSLVIPRITFLLPVPTREVLHPSYSYRSLATPYFSLTASLRAPPSY